MNNSNAILTLEGLAKKVEAGVIDTVIMAFTDLYGRFMGKRLDASYFLEKVCKQGVHACNYLMAVDMAMNPVAGYKFASWDQGYGDFLMVGDLTTLRTIDWLDKTALIICDLFDTARKELIPLSPRALLRKQCEKVKNLNFISMMASELEHYLFRDSYRIARTKNYHAVEPIGEYNQDYHILQTSREETYTQQVRGYLKRSGISVESSKGECGFGQQEINLRYETAFEMADRHMIFKQCLKEVADRMGFSVTFMAKPYDEQPGSSCHIHCSLWSENENVFTGTEKLGELSCSKLFKWFLGGWMHYTRELMVFYAPTVNSYKRYQEGSWAPTKIAWSLDNRTAGFRIVGSGQDLRIEFRIPGADCNPYLAYAAILASGLHGIQNQIEPPPMLSGNLYQADNVGEVPKTLYEAVECFRASEFAKQVFGETVVNHYLNFFALESKAYNQSVTDWERKRYFEQI